MSALTSYSFARKVFAKPAASVAVVIIMGFMLVAALAYVLAPDNTPYANRMIVEYSVKEPGFSNKVLLVPKKIIQKQPGHLTGWWNGTPSDFNYVPVNQVWLEDNEIMAQHYIDDGLSDTLRYTLQELLPAEKKHFSAQAAKNYIQENSVRQQTYLLGTDRYGRDILSRLLVGARVSIAVGIVAVILSLTIGIILGSLAGYFGGWVDNAVMWIINILWAIPTLLLVFSITLTIGKGFWEIFVAIGLTMWVSAARLIRGQVMVLKEMEYVTAAKALGLTDIRIIFRHVLPNIAGPIMVIAASNFATAILVEAGLSFLGIGVQPPQPSWGLMIKEHYNFLITNRPVLAIIPGIAIMLLVYAFNILGNALRDVLDVRES
ncbi:MAG TPA: ABC transporter permease [Flavipsychrobacter sp.]|nr:ABC transporter permease [Flavipsychrobacter sp.]